ncbi:DUF4333 domain-containing protein [Nocardiopsis alkaliphila]|uniref:DUF4333 domain-containing protein n=1 Tax=Nocardiopsis alkaliphila TaxID=225762 RepID=UPI00034A1B53|nr:DUF4333 domain-containing protein [Nocardiopsis alkaliphila]
MRRIPHNRILVGTVLGTLSVLLATGCSFDFSLGGPGVIEAEQVAEKSSEMLAEQIGEAPDEFTCSEDLPAEVGAEIRCELTHGGESLGVTVTTTSVDGDQAEWDIKVDEAPADDTAAGEDSGSEDNSTAASGGQVSNTEVINQTSTVLEAQGHSPENFTCNDTHLVAEVGAELGCQFMENGATHHITVTVTSVEGDNVLWDIEFDEAQ